MLTSTRIKTIITRDLYGQNVTYVNGIESRPGTDTVVISGSKIKLGGCIIINSGRLKLIVSTSLIS